MVLKSTDSALFHSSNQPYSFRIHLPRPLDVKGVWTVSLLEFSLDLGKTKQQGFPEVFVCSDICEDTIVGDRELPLLRRVYLDKENIIYQSPYEVPVKLLYKRCQTFTRLISLRGSDSDIAIEKVSILLMM